MKRRLIKIFAIIMVLGLVLPAVSGCSASRRIKSTKEEAQIVGKVGEFEVRYDELRYFTLNYKDALKKLYGDDIWDNAEKAELYRDELERLVYSSITSNYAILSLCREVYIEADDRIIQEAVDDYMKDFIDEIGGRGEYKKALNKYHMTDYFLRFTIAVDYCRNELYYVYVDDLGLIEKDEEAIYDLIMAGECVRTLHVYIDNGAKDDIDENRRKAEEVRDRLLAGEDIKKIIGSSINEDFNLTTTDGYYFFRGEMLKKYEEAAFSLEVGGTSDVVETDTGFYIIQRFPLEKTYVLLNLETLAENYRQAQLDLMIEERQSELVFVPNEYGASLDLTKIS